MQKWKWRFKAGYRLTDDWVRNFCDLFCNIDSDNGVFCLENVCRDFRRRPTVGIFRSLVQVVRGRVVADWRNLFGQWDKFSHLFRSDFSAAVTFNLKTKQKRIEKKKTVSEHKINSKRQYTHLLKDYQGYTSRVEKQMRREENGRGQLRCNTTLVISSNIIWPNSLFWK